MVCIYLMWLYRNLRPPPKKLMPQIAHSEVEKPYSGKIQKLGALLIAYLMLQAIVFASLPLYLYSPLPADLEALPPPIYQYLTNCHFMQEGPTHTHSQAKRRLAIPPEMVKLKAFCPESSL